MGNISSMARASTALDSYVAELGNDISYDKSLSSSRFLKTILARHAYGPIVLKIFIKPDAAMSLRVIQRRLKAERDALADVPGINSYQAFVETDKAGYLIRQWVGSNLYDRVSTQPYLASIEKKWIAFQILLTMRDARNRRVAHGDIKSENVLITSDLSVVLTDFSSSFKPTFLPIDDPSDFSFFYDTSARRTCYIAPERFYDADSKLAEEKRAAALAGKDYGEGWGKRDGRVTEDMDVFSCGCVLAEMWTDGRTVFNLSELYAYREGSLGLDGLLGNLEDESVRSLIKAMLARDPKDRPSFDLILSKFRETVFPEYFYTFLKDYVTSLSELPDSPAESFIQKSAAVPGTKIDRMLDEWDTVAIHLDESSGRNDGPALLLLNIVTSSIRSCLWPSTRLHALHIFTRLLPYLEDEDKVDRIIPFSVELLSDEAAIVRAEACRTIVKVLESTRTISSSNATFIPEYLLPNMRRLCEDKDTFVRTVYAGALVKIADAAVRMLELSQAVKGPPSGPESSVTGIVEPDFDAMLVEIQSSIEEQAIILLVDPSSSVKRSMLAAVADLCLFFGRQKSNETVLSHMMTYLNDRDWLLRMAFFDGIVGVGAFIGIRAIEEYVLPLMLQALADPEEGVIARVIAALTSLTSLGLMPRMRIWDIFSSTRGFLAHPNALIRQGTAGFIAAAARNLPPSDVWCILYPIARTMLRCDVLELDEDSILSNMKPYLSRAMLKAAKAAALQNSPAGFWGLAPSKGTAKNELVKEVTQLKVSECVQLRDKGFSSKDERKIRALRDFIVKQAYAARARENTEQAEHTDAALTASKSISLTDLGVTLQTIFISPRTVGVDAKADLRRLRPLLTESGSRRTSFASRSNRDVDDPAGEIRKRLTSLEPHPRPVHPAVGAPEMPPLDSAVSDSGFSATLDFAGVPRAGGNRKKVEAKAAPAIGAVHTTAIGTTTIHDDAPAILSGRTTPTAIRAGAVTPANDGQTNVAAEYNRTSDRTDPGLRAFLEQIDLDTYREPLLDFGPRVASSGRKRTRGKTSSSQGVTLIGHLTQHLDTVTSIITSPDHVFFATASHDTQVLIWDTVRMERSVAAKARLTYRMDSPISAMCRIENTYCLAVAAEDGQLHVIRVHVSSGTSSKYAKVECLRAWTAAEQDGYVRHVAHVDDSSLLVVTSASVIAKLDMRTMEISARLQHPLEYGVISAICPTRHWLVVGTTSGIISLWDLRFGLLIKSWRVGGAVTSLAIHPSKGRGRWLVVSTTRRSAEAPVVETYDIETAKLVEVYEIRSGRHGNSTNHAANGVSATTSSAVGEDGIPSRVDLLAELAAGRSLPPVDDEERPTSVLAVAVGQSMMGLSSKDVDSLSGLIADLRNPSSSGYMVTAGDDRAVRYWDMSRAGEGFVICGSTREKDVTFKQGAAGSTPQTYYTQPNAHRHASGDSRNATVASGRNPLRPHYDAISALGVVETPFSSCVISGDRSGVVKVWRVEGGPK